jgi:hypothetical protein
VESTFRLNQPHVASEELAGDLMLLHFGSGLYYNLSGVGADMCAFLLAGGTVAAAAAAMATRFGLEVSVVNRDVEVFVRRLVDEGLLVATPRPAYTKPMRITAKVYEPPQFQKYDDMADQLLLDKIDDQSTQVRDPLVP